MHVTALNARTDMKRQKAGRWLSKGGLDWPGRGGDISGCCSPLLVSEAALGALDSGR